MKRITVLFALLMSLLSLPLSAQKEMKDVDLINIKTLLIAQWQKCEELFAISDLDIAALGLYSTIKYDVKEYVEKFGDYTMQDYLTDMRLVDKRGSILFIHGFGFDYDTGALVVEGPDSYLICNGKTGITFNKEGERDDRGSAEYDTAGRIIDWSWARQKRAITYSKAGYLYSVEFLGKRYIFTWKDGLLSEISVREVYGNKEETTHYWAEVVERNNNGYWTELDIYEKSKNKEKVKSMRYSRHFD